MLHRATFARSSGCSRRAIRLADHPCCVVKYARRSPTSARPPAPRDSTARRRSGARADRSAPRRAGARRRRRGRRERAHGPDGPYRRRAWAERELRHLVPALEPPGAVGHPRPHPREALQHPLEGAPVGPAAVSTGRQPRLETLADRRLALASARSDASTRSAWRPVPRPPRGLTARRVGSCAARRGDARPRTPGRARRSRSSRSGPPQVAPVYHEVAFTAPVWARVRRTQCAMRDVHRALRETRRGFAVARRRTSRHALRHASPPHARRHSRRRRAPSPGSPSRTRHRVATPREGVPVRTSAVRGRSGPGLPAAVVRARRHIVGVPTLPTIHRQTERIPCAQSGRSPEPRSRSRPARRTSSPTPPATAPPSAP